MKFTPKCRVSYKGAFYAPNMVIDIESCDAEEMSKYGCIVDSEKADESSPDREEKPKAAKNRASESSKDGKKAAPVRRGRKTREADEV